MGRYAICTSEDSVEACISAARVNIRMFEEDLAAGRDSGYLLTFAQSCLAQAETNYERHKQTVAEKSSN